MTTTDFDAGKPAFYTSADGFDAPAPLTVGDFRRARRLTHQEKNNG
jgi:hypothetical protein